ncbi:hypothetical protein U1Q18_051524 [Sarracenia purpurea var. burkii]
MKFNGVLNLVISKFEYVVMMRRPKESATGSGLLAPFEYELCQKIDSVLEEIKNQLQTIGLKLKEKTSAAATSKESAPATGSAFVVGKSKSNVTCYNCGKRGHVSKKGILPNFVVNQYVKLTKSLKAMSNLRTLELKLKLNFQAPRPNYPEWRFRVDLVIKQMTLGHNKKKSLPDEVELNVMFNDARKCESFESIQQKIANLGDRISDTAFKTRLLSVLPKRFSPFVSASNLMKKIDLRDLLSALTSEDIRLNKNFKRKRTRNSATSFHEGIDGLLFVWRSGPQGSRLQKKEKDIDPRLKIIRILFKKSPVPASTAKRKDTISNAARIGETRKGDVLQV